MSVSFVVSSSTVTNHLAAQQTKRQCDSFPLLVVFFFYFGCTQFKQQVRSWYLFGKIADSTRSSTVLFRSHRCLMFDEIGCRQQHRYYIPFPASCAISSTGFYLGHHSPVVELCIVLREEGPGEKTNLVSEAFPLTGTCACWDIR